MYQMKIKSKDFVNEVTDIFFEGNSMQVYINMNNKV